MTLMERVKVAEAECGSIASVSRDAWMLDELKDEVGAVIPGDVLASLSVENPKRARSELRRAVQSIYALPNGHRVHPIRKTAYSPIWSMLFSGWARCSRSWKTNR